MTWTTLTESSNVSKQPGNGIPLDERDEASLPHRVYRRAGNGLDVLAEKPQGFAVRYDRFRTLYPGKHSGCGLYVVLFPIELWFGFGESGHDSRRRPFLFH